MSYSVLQSNLYVPASVRQRLLNLSKARHDNFNRLLTQYALERLLQVWPPSGPWQTEATVAPSSGNPIDPSER